MFIPLLLLVVLVCFIFPTLCGLVFCAAPVVEYLLAQVRFLNGLIVDVLDQLVFFPDKGSSFGTEFR